MITHNQPVRQTGGLPLHWTPGSSNVAVARHYPGGTHRNFDGTLTYTVAGHQNSIVSTINATTGAVTHNRYLPYGELRDGTTNNDKGFLNQTHDDATNLVYLNNRHHDPTLGTFTSVDPLVTTTGEAYIYAGANPIALSDPTGLCGHCLIPDQSVFDIFEPPPATVSKYAENRDNLMTARINSICQYDFWGCATDSRNDAFTKSVFAGVEAGLLEVTDGRIRSTLDGLAPIWGWTESGGEVRIDLLLADDAAFPWILVDGAAILSGISCPLTGFGCLPAAGFGALSTAKSASDLIGCVADGCDGLVAAAGVLDVATRGLGKVTGNALEGAVDAGHIGLDSATAIQFQVDAMFEVVNSIGFVGAGISSDGDSVLFTTSFTMVAG